MRRGRPGAAQRRPGPRAHLWGGGGGRVRGAAEYSQPRSGASPTPASTFRLGDDVEHPAFGDGVVIAARARRLVVVRFANDGSEKKLMADYAPLNKK